MQGCPICCFCGARGSDCTPITSSTSNIPDASKIERSKKLKVAAATKQVRPTAPPPTSATITGTIAGAQSATPAADSTTSPILVDQSGIVHFAVPIIDLADTDVALPVASPA